MRKLATLKRLVDHKALYCQLIITRRCNLACGYCNEYDHTSKPVPYETLVRYIDHAVDELGVTIMDFLGGEPLLHPRVVDLVRHARARGCWVNIITNGFLLSADLVDRLNDAGLDSMAVSIDRIEPTDYTQKGLRPIRKKLDHLRRGARFQVETNTVLCDETLGGFRALVAELKEMGFPVRASVVHDRGRARPDPRLVAEYEWFQRHFRHYRTAPLMDMMHARARGEAPEWKCTGGYKFLYVDEFGMIRACSQVALPEPRHILDTRAADLKENDRHKPCEAECGVSCVIQTSLLTRNPLGYAARCATHLVSTRGEGAALGGVRKRPGRRAARAPVSDV